MSVFGGLILTNKGRNLQIKAQLGTQLQFTRVGVGDGELGGSSILELNALKNETKSLSITKLKSMTEGQAVIGTYLSSNDVVSGFYYRELGLFANDPDEGEILYCYGNSGANAEYIPASSSEDIIEKNIDIIALVGNASSVSAVINQSLVFETPAESQAKADVAEQNAKDYTDAHEAKASNPHNVTAAQVGAETEAGAQVKANAAETNANTYTDNALIPVNTPTYIAQTNQERIFNPPVGAYDGYVKCMEIRGQTLFNFVMGGDFNDTSHWTTQAGTLSVSNNIASVTGDGTNQSVRLGQNLNHNISVDDVVNRKLKVRVTNANCTSILVRIALDSFGGTFLVSEITIDNPTQNEWYPISQPDTATANGNAFIEIVHTYVDATTANGKVMEVDGIYGVYFFNQTAQGIQSKTAADIDNMISNGYFEGFGHAEAVTLNSCGKNLVKNGNGELGLDEWTPNDTSSFALVDGYFELYDNKLVHSSPFRLQQGIVTIQLYGQVVNSTSYGFYLVEENGELIQANYISSTLKKHKFEIDVPTAGIYKIKIVNGSSGMTARFKEVLCYQGAVADPMYEEYKSSAPITTTHTLRSLPNGVADKYFVKDGIVYHEQNVGIRVLEASDITNITTTGTLIDYVRIMFQSDQVTTYDTQGNNIATSKTTPRFSKTTDSTESFWSHYTGSSGIETIVPKGTYGDVEAAGADYEGSIMLYELATPIVTATDINPSLLTYKNGSISIEATGIVSEFYAEYPGNAAAQRDSNTERISQMIKTEDVSTPKYISQTNAETVFSRPANAVDGFVKSLRVNGQSAFSSVVGGESFQTTEYSNDITDKFTTLTFKQGDTWYFGADYELVEGIENANAGQVRIVSPETIILVKFQTEPNGSIVTFGSDITATSIYAYGPITDDGSGRIANWKNLTAINLTAMSWQNNTAEYVHQRLPKAFEGWGHVENVVINACGKNLFDERNLEKTVESGKTVLVFNGYVRSSGSMSGNPLILSSSLKKGQTYTVQGKFKKTDYWNNLAIRYEDSTVVSVGSFADNYGESSLKFTTSSTKNVACLFVDTGSPSSNGYAEEFTIQLERGDTETQYEPYKPSRITFPVTLRSVPSANDYAEIRNGKLVKVEKVKKGVLQGGDITGLSTTGGAQNVLFSKPAGFIYEGISGTSLIASSAMSIANFTPSGDIGVGKLIEWDSTRMALGFELSTYPDLETAQADLAGETVLYELAEPVITELADLSSLFLAYENIWIETDKVVPEVEAEYCGNVAAVREQNAIATNSNSSVITNNRASINTNEANITTNATNIGTNTMDIATVNSRLDGESIHFGSASVAGATKSTAVGFEANAGNYSVATGYQAIATGTYSGSHGCEAEAPGYGSGAYGYRSKATSKYGMGIGHYAGATRYGEVAINLGGYDKYQHVMAGFRTQYEPADVSLELFLDYASNSERFTLDARTFMVFNLTIVAVDVFTGNLTLWKMDNGVIVRTDSSISLVSGSLNKLVNQLTGAGVTVSADSTNNSLKIVASGSDFAEYIVRLEGFEYKYL